MTPNNPIDQGEKVPEGLDTVMCPYCKKDILADLSFRNISEKVECQLCGNKSQIAYEESYDENTGDEWGWFFLERVDA